MYTNDITHLLAKEEIQFSKSSMKINTRTSNGLLITYFDTEGHTISNIFWNIRPSPTCCGIAEIGDFSKGDRFTSDDWLKFTELSKKYFHKLVAVNCIFAYLPKLDWAIWRELLKELGFIETMEFYNPNTRHQVFQYRWIRPEKEQK